MRRLLWSVGIVASLVRHYQGLCPKCHHGWVYCNDQGCACDYCGAVFSGKR